ncbi:MAG: potassium channel family protein [Pseudomonadota bacterium]
MPLFLRFKVLFVRLFIDVRWYAIIAAIGLYVVATWILLWLAGEDDLVASRDFLYWLMVTASTVGYGDLSPVTTFGKHVVGLFVVPFGLGIFGMTVGRLAAFVSHQWRKGVMGMKTLKFDRHILVIGWIGNRTLHLLRLLQRENTGTADDRDIALCVRAEIENPLTEEMGFVRVKSFTDSEEMDRAGVHKASCIIIDNPEDDVTMTVALYCSKRNPDAHIIAYFKDEHLGAILREHCPNVECMPSVSVEMMAKAAADPGSSALHQELLDVDSGMTQYSICMGADRQLQVRDLFTAMKEAYDAILIGVSRPDSREIRLNPRLDETIDPGETIYYIADERIPSVDWSRI